MTVDASNTQFAGSDLITTTAADGSYSYTLDAMTWHVTAHQMLRYNGYTVSVDLVPDTDEEVPGFAGGVRNFIFQSKAITPEDPYGNLGMVMIDEMSGEFDIDFSKVEVTLTPLGLLADGTTGTPHVLHLHQMNSGWIIPNVM
ncbi:hypothetical protein [Deinococcus ruber]|uniref:Uncharacterized protein n=1 Tax=Deinococcus ruber TaxID=1848197 RepID=A0A918CNR3_9DEIO|nr:hypothetical protein [Deinococcus ruber]GGR30998.1 hypothetical protein GCM10008957_47180 [Deinococcus ruber]